MSIIFQYFLAVFVAAVGSLCRAEDDFGMDLIDDTKTRGQMQEHAPLSPTQAAEAAKIAKLLDTLFADCGRYPTTQEGLKALVTKLKTLKCKKWGIKKAGRLEPYILSVPQGWKYVSLSGSSYTIEPSK